MGIGLVRMYKSRFSFELAGGYNNRTEKLYSHIGYGDIIKPFLESYDEPLDKFPAEEGEGAGKQGPDEKILGELLVVQLLEPGDALRRQDEPYGGVVAGQDEEEKEGPLYGSDDLAPLQFHRVLLTLPGSNGRPVPYRGGVDAFQHRPYGMVCLDHGEKQAEEVDQELPQCRNPHVPGQEICPQEPLQEGGQARNETDLPRGDAEEGARPQNEEGQLDKAGPEQILCPPLRESHGEPVEDEGEEDEKGRGEGGENRDQQDQLQKGQGEVSPYADEGAVGPLGQGPHQEKAVEEIEEGVGGHSPYLARSLSFRAWK